MKISKHLPILALFLVLAIAVASCAGAVEPPDDDSDPGQPTDVPAVGGELVYGITGEPVILNPILATDTPSAFVNSRIYAGLVRADENLQMEPYVAHDWEYSDDGLEWTFYLRDDVYFHDGELLTAEDVVYTYMTILDPDYTGVRASSYAPVEEVVAEDDFTVRFSLHTPYAPLLSTLGMGILPSHLYSDTPVAELRELDVNMEPVGSGPYTFKEWQSGQYVILERNPDFFLDGPFIETVNIRIYGDGQVVLAALEAGDIDLLGAIPPDDVDRITEEYADRLEFHNLQQNGYSYIGLKQTDPILSDVRVRQALMYGIDRQGIVDNILGGLGTVMNANIPGFSWVHNPNLNPYEYNPDTAIELLEDAGWTEVADDGIRMNAEGERLTITTVSGTGDTLREDVMLIAQQNLAEIGVELKPEFYEWSVLLNQYLDVAKFQSYLLSWSLSTDPDDFITFHSSAGVNEDGQLAGFNDVEYSNPEVDELLERGRTTMDKNERQQIYFEVQEILNEELPYVFLFSRDVVAAVHKDVKGVVMTGIGSLYPERWYIETESVAAKD